MKKKLNEAPSEPIPTYVTLPLNELLELLAFLTGESLEEITERYYYLRGVGTSQMDCVKLLLAVVID